MARSQVLHFADNFSATIAIAAWRAKPSWMIVAGGDRTINPDLERWYAKRAGSHTVEVAGASKVTIVEPGGFRTDFAGSSTQLSEGHPEYDATVGTTARFQRDYNGKQPGDPKKAALAIVQVTQEQKPPLRLLLGSDAYKRAEKNDLARLAEAKTWKELSLSTDFESEFPHPARTK